VHGSLGQQGKDGGANVAAASPGPTATSSSAAAGVMAGELLAWIWPAVS